MKNRQNIITLLLLVLLESLLMATSPVVTSTALTVATQDSAYSYTLTASDVDLNDEFTWGVINKPSWLTFTNIGDATATGTKTVAGGLTRGIHISPDGTKVYYGSDGTNLVYELTLSTPYDITTATQTATMSFNAELGSNAFMNVSLNDIGTRLYVTNLNLRTIYQYNMTTAYDLTTASYSGNSFNFNAQMNKLHGSTFNSDGSKMYVTDYVAKKVFQYTLSTPYALSSVVYDNKSFDFSAQGIEPRDIKFKANGTKIFLASLLPRAVYEYNLTTAYDISTVVYANKSTNYPNDEVLGLSFADHYTKLYIIADASKIIQYNNSPSKLTGTPTNADVGVHDVNLTVTDGTNTVAQNFQITVANVNDTPTDIALSNNSITENNATGITIGTLSTIDIDLGDSFTYSFCGGTDDANFSISSNNLQTNAVFNYEVKSSYSVCIRTKDSGNVTFDKTFAITILNINEAPIFTAISNQTKAEDFANYSVGLSASDPEGDSLTYTAFSHNSSIVDVNVSGTNLNFFGVANASGTVSIDVNVTDGVFVDSKSLTITITPTNDITIITSTAITATTQDSAYSYILSASDVDLNDEFTWTITNKPSWLSFDNTGDATATGTKIVTGGGTRGIHISPDGTKAYYGSDGTDLVYELTLSTPYDITTAMQTATMSFNP